jgi:hypothetical protein
MTPAEELTAAARTLREAKFRGAMTATATVAALIRTREPLAKLLREIAALHTPTACDKHEGCTPLGCDWCGDEDWPCNDMRNALAVARQILGTTP